MVSRELNCDVHRIADVLNHPILFALHLATAASSCCVCVFGIYERRWARFVAGHSWRKPRLEVTLDFLKLLGPRFELLLLLFLLNLLKRCTLC